MIFNPDKRLLLFFFKCYKYTNVKECKTRSIQLYIVACGWLENFASLAVDFERWFPVPTWSSCSSSCKKGGKDHNESRTTWESRLMSDRNLPSGKGLYPLTNVRSSPTHHATNQLPSVPVPTLLYSVLCIVLTQWHAKTQNKLGQF